MSRSTLCLCAAAVLTLIACSEPLEPTAANDAIAALR